MGRLVQSSPVARTDRQHSAGRTRDHVSSIHGSVADGGLTQTRGSPENPGRFSLASYGSIAAGLVASIILLGEHLTVGEMVAGLYLVTALCLSLVPLSAVSRVFHASRQSFAG